MLEFTPSDPYPLIDFKSVSYSETLRHSRAVDAWLGFDFERIESSLEKEGSRARPSLSSRESQQLWFGLEVQSLLTPYVELRALLEKLKLRAGQTVVDLGAAYGRLGFILARHCPGVQFTGYEYVGERVLEARRVLKKRGILSNFDATTSRSLDLDPRQLMVHADLSAPGFQPRLADVYFIYDFGTLKAIEKTLYDLRRLAETVQNLNENERHDFTLVARGRHCRTLIESRHSWLTRAFPGEPESRATIYRMESVAGVSPGRVHENSI